MNHLPRPAWGRTRLCGATRQAHHHRVAAIEHLGPPDASAWLLLRGRVWEGDEQVLVEQALAHDADVVVDLTDVADLTAGGCWALRQLADRLWERGRRVTILVPAVGAPRTSLERSGTMGYPRIRFEETRV